MSKKESDFVHDTLKPELTERFPNCVIIKQDPNTSFQGVPDLLVLFEDKWAALETKRGAKSSQRPNQAHYVAKMNDMSFSAFVNPDNYHEVLDDLSRTFRPGR